MTVKSQDDPAGIVERLQTELDKRFSVLDERTTQAELKEIKGKNAKLIMKLIAYSTTEDEEKLEHLYKSQCATAQDKRLLTNLEDQYARTALFYAIYKGNHHI